MIICFFFLYFFSQGGDAVIPPTTPAQLIYERLRAHVTGSSSESGVIEYFAPDEVSDDNDPDDSQNRGI